MKWYLHSRYQSLERALIGTIVLAYNLCMPHNTASHVFTRVKRGSLWICMAMYLRIKLEYAGVIEIPGTFPTISFILYQMREPYQMSMMTTFQFSSDLYLHQQAGITTSFFPTLHIPLQIVGFDEPSWALSHFWQHESRQNVGKRESVSEDPIQKKS